MNLTPDQVIAVGTILLTFVMFILGGIGTVLWALICYIFNSRIKDTDRRLSEYQDECKSESKSLWTNMDNLRVADSIELKALAKAVGEIQVSVAQVKTLIGNKE